MSREFRLTLTLDNAAFESHEELEVARILRELSTDLELLGAECLPLRDINGNTCGHAEFVDETGDCA